MRIYTFTIALLMWSCNEVSARGGGSSGGDGGGVTRQVLVSEERVLTNKDYAMWDPKIDKGAEIGGVIGGIVGYLLFIYTLATIYGARQDHFLKL